MGTEYKSKASRRPRFYRGEHRMHAGHRHWWQPRPGAEVIPLSSLFDEQIAKTIDLAAAA